MTDISFDELFVNSPCAIFNMLKGSLADVDLALAFLMHAPLSFQRYRHVKKLAVLLKKNIVKRDRLLSVDIENRNYNIHIILTRLRNRDYKLTTDEQQEANGSPQHRGAEGFWKTHY